MGLTGGIGCGKSTVARLFAALGVPVIDADEIARELIQPGGTAFAAVVDAFGEGILRNGAIDRSALRERIFRVPEEKRRLEGLLHPLVFQEMERQLRQIDATYAIVCIPLLLETGRRDFVDRILVVDCPVRLQLARVAARDRVPEAAVRRILRNQAPRKLRLEAADEIIRNETDTSALTARVGELHRRYLALATARASRA